MQHILGIDPGLRETGWGVIGYHANDNVLHYVASGSITTKTNQEMVVRLRTLFHGVQRLMHDYAPVSVAIEEMFVNRSPVSTVKLSHARAAVMLAAGEPGVDVIELHNRQIKKSIVGVGNAEKAQMLAMVKFLLPRMETRNEHAVDALATAICARHLSQNSWADTRASSG